MEIKFSGTIDNIIAEIQEFKNRVGNLNTTPREPETKKTAQPTTEVPAKEEEKEAKPYKQKENPTEESALIIAKFPWDKNTEKQYKTIRFCELEDGRVMLWYTNSRVFTTKEKIMGLPYPIPYGYEQLKDFNGNKKVAIRSYREYLATNPILQTGESLSERNERLKKVAETNKKRWDTKKPKEMSAKTKALRENVVMKMTLGVGAEPKTPKENE